MSQANISLRSFNGGQIGPRSEGRTDIEQYGTSARLIKNLIPRVNGSMVRRPGTRYSTTALQSDATTYPSRLISFEIGDNENYLLELNEYKMRIFKDTGPMTYPSRTLRPDELLVNGTHINSIGTAGCRYLFATEFGHGFYHGQGIRFSSSGVAPNGLSTNVTYYVVLPRTLHFLDGGTHNSSEVEFRISNPENLFLIPGQGPYSLRADFKKSVFGSGGSPDVEHPYGAPPNGGGYYVDSVDATAGNPHVLFRHGRAQDAAHVDGHANPTVAEFRINVTAVPTEEAYATTFQLATDYKDLYGSVFQTNLPSVAGSMVIETSYGNAAVPEEIVINTPWTNAEVWELDFSHGIDRMFFYHENHPPFELNRWNVGAFRFVPVPIEHTPVGELSPDGVDVKIELKEYDNAGAVTPKGLTDSQTEQLGEMFYAVTQRGSGVFDAGDVGQSFRWLNPAGVPGSVANDAGAEKVQVVGRIDRIGDEYAGGIIGHRAQTRLPLPEAFFDASDISGTNITVDDVTGFAVGDPVSFVSGSTGLVGNIAEGQVLFVQSIAAPVINVETTSGGGAITVTTQTGGGARHSLISHRLVLEDIAGAVFALSGNFGEDEGRIGLHMDGEPAAGLYPGHVYRLRVLDAVNGRCYLELHGGDDDGKIPWISTPGHGLGFLSSDGLGKTSSADIRTTIDGGYQEGKIGYQTPNFRYHRGEWGPLRGWPRAGTQYEQRHIAAGSFAYPNRVWASQTGNDVSWAPYNDIGVIGASGTSVASQEQRQYETLDTSGFSFDPLSSSTSHVQWCHGHNILIVATRSEIFEIAASSNREALTPANVNARIVSTVGANRVKPVRAGSDILYISSSGSEVSALLFDGVSAASTPQSLTVWSEDTVNSEITQLAWQNEPFPILWLCRKDGELWGCTYDREQSVVGWHSHQLGGTDSMVKSIATIRHDAADARDSYDRLWLSVSRTIDSNPVQYIEWMDPGLQDWEDSRTALYLDCAPAHAGTTNPNTPAFLAGSLDWLVGETVTAWTKFTSDDYAREGTSADTTGTVPLVVAVGGSLPAWSSGAQSTVVGLPYESQYSSLPLESVADTSGSEATIQGLRKRIVDAWVRVYRSHDGAISSQLAGDIASRTSLGNEDDGTNEVFTGVVQVRGMQHEWNEEATLDLLVTGPVPFELLSIVTRVDWSER